MIYSCDKIVNDFDRQKYCITEISKIEELQDYLFFTEFVIIICIIIFGTLAFILYILEAEQIENEA